MKQLLSTLFCVLCSTVLLAQTYYPMPTTTSAQWRIRATSSASFPPSISGEDYKITGDTIVGTRTYHKIGNRLGFRESAKKIYAVNFNNDNVFIFSERPDATLGVEYLVMDFGAAVGAAFQRRQNEYVTVESISTYQMPNGTTRRQYNLQGTCLNEKWVEGIGAIEHSCFEYVRNCTGMIGDNGYVLGSGSFITPNPVGCQATMTSTMISPNVFVIRNTSPANFQYKFFEWQNCPLSSVTSRADSIIININNTITCTNPSNSQPPIVYTPAGATIYLTVWNDAATCYSKNYITVGRDTSCRANYTINRISADSFLVRNITPPNTYTQAQFSGRQCSPNATSRVIVYPLPNQECMAIAPVPFGGCYPNIYPFSLNVSNALCSNTKAGDLPYTAFCTTDCFFAGDTNRDSIANNMDLLPIALNIGNTGQARTNTNFNLDWVAHEPKTWTTTTPNSTINASFSDCDNSGVITAADTTIILRNYGFKNNRKTGVFQRPQTTNTAPVLRCQFAADTLRNIEIPYRLDADIRIGDATQTIPNLYGVAFSINYDTTIAQKARINWDALAWLGTPAELLVLQKNNAEGKIDIAIARNDHQPRTGSGKLAAVSFFIQDNNGGSLTNTSFQATVTDLKAIDQNGIDINLNGGTASVVLENMVLGAMTNRSEMPTIRLYPNPTYNRQFRYELTGAIRCSKIEITNLLGQTIYTQNNPATDILLPENTRPGVYSVVFYTDKGRIVQKVVVME
jgi:hypothetical protein